MGFSTTVFLAVSGNTLTGRGLLPALSTIDAAVVPGVLNNAVFLASAATDQQNLTCFVMSSQLTQSIYNGGIDYVTNQNGIFTYTDGYSGTATRPGYPYKLYSSLAAKNGFASNQLFYTLSATGQECASGVQTATVLYTLSSTALSGTSAGLTGAGVILVTLNSVLTSFDTDVYCQNFVNTQFDPTSAFICDDDRRRMTVIVQG